MYWLTVMHYLWLRIKLISIEFNTQFINTCTCIWKKQNGDSWQSTYQWNILYISIYSYTSKSCFVAVLYGVSANFTTFCIDQSFFSRENISTSRSQKGTYSMYRYIYIESKTIWKIENLHDLFLTTQCTKEKTFRHIHMRYYFSR